MKQFRSLLFVTLSLSVAFTFCKRQADHKLACGPEAVISKEQFETAPRDELVLQALKITGDCLTAKISADVGAMALTGWSA